MTLLQPSSTFTMYDVRNPKSLLSDEVLADRLGLTTREFQRYRKQNLVTVSSIVAVGESGGLMVICQFGNRVWEGLVVNGCIAFEEVRFLRGKRATGPRLGSSRER
ncbi:hypothetical protein CO663_32295 [Rhizobium anhuiense]|jgi:hypothetical protein|uniref:hypothetical protein n=1 Tax=Rhizobium anhuiense TaxID=1184720 RepID=UPI000BE9E895|nr:hypothetical protein [Rhizobium anhuiense]PDS54965.1 hypothetical protein CO663_32295 [Rhizobium anhuiense]